MDERLLLIFSRQPYPGRVKRRLQGRHGRLGATRIHRDLLQRSLASTEGGDAYRRQLWLAPGRWHPFTDALARRYGLPMHVQRRGDLGVRMHHALRRALRESEYAVLIGSDSPVIDRGYIETAFERLTAGAGVVLGPAEDGGFLLIGMRRGASLPLTAMRWGDSQVLQRTRQRLRMAGVCWSELPSLWDVDRPADVKRMRRLGRPRR